MSRATASNGESGLRVPADPPHDATPYDIAMHYLKYFEAEFSRTRRVVKGRARNVTISTAVLTALIAVTGSVTAVLNLAWLGIFSAAIAGAATVIERWDALFRHREMWVQRSATVSKLQKLRREAEFWRAREGATDEVGQRVLARLEEILSQEMESWSSIRDNPQRGDKGTNNPNA